MKYVLVYKMCIYLVFLIIVILFETLEGIRYLHTRTNINILNIHMSKQEKAFNIFFS